MEASRQESRRNPEHGHLPQDTFSATLNQPELSGLSSLSILSSDILQSASAQPKREAVYLYPHKPHAELTEDEALLHIAEYAGHLPGSFIDVRRALRRNPKEEWACLLQERIYSGDNLQTILKKLREDGDLGERRRSASKKFIETGSYCFLRNPDVASALGQSGRHQAVPTTEKIVSSRVKPGRTTNPATALASASRKTSRNPRVTPPLVPNTPILENHSHEVEASSDQASDAAENIFTQPGAYQIPVLPGNGEAPAPGAYIVKTGRSFNAWKVKFGDGRESEWREPMPANDRQMNHESCYRTYGLRPLSTLQKEWAIIDEKIRALDVKKPGRATKKQ